LARIEKYHTGIKKVIQHNIREFKSGKCPTNIEVNPEKSKDNYSLIRRGNTAKEIEAYRKKITAECFHYKRKNIVFANEVIFTLPHDTPYDQEYAFFEESLKYLINTLPMGEKCIFLAEVHCDEGQILKDGKTVVEGQKHLHVMYVPAVADSKHDGYHYKLCSDALTRRSVLKQWHPKYQKWLDYAGIKGTVYSGKTSGKGISVKSLKEISKTTGLSFDQIQDLEKDRKELLKKIRTLEEDHTQSKQTTQQYESTIMKLKSLLLECDQTIQTLQENAKLHSAEKEALLNRLKEKESLLSVANEKLQDLTVELQQSNEKIKELENTTLHSHSPADQEHTWGNDSWGTQSEWGKTIDKENEHLW
jgi:hypothetical protein